MVPRGATSISLTSLPTIESEAQLGNTLPRRREFSMPLHICEPATSLGVATVLATDYLLPRPQ